MDLKVINKVFSTAGHENLMKNYIRERLASTKVEVLEDKFGNLAVKVGSGNEKIAVSAHMDAFGLICSYIEEDGKVRFGILGNLKPKDIINTIWVFENGLEGIVRSEDDSTDINKLYLDMYINKEEIKKCLSVGNTAYLIPYYFENEKNLAGSNLNRNVNIEILLSLISENINYSNEVYFVFTCEQNLDGRGARAVSNFVKPDYFISLDLCDHDDIGENPLIVTKSLGFLINDDCKNIVLNAYKNANIKPAFKVTEEFFETKFVQTEGDGVKCSIIAIPAKGKFTSSQVICKENIEKVKSILKNI